MKSKDLNKENNYICKFCNKEYKSDGLRKPKSYKKDGSIHQTYDSTLFCSKECCKKYTIERFKQTIKDNPKIIKKRIEKFRQNIQNNPDITKTWAEKRKQTYKEHPEIKAKQIERFKQTIKDNP